MAAILQLRAVKAFYGQSEVLHGIDLAVEEAGMTVLLGANGAGKTTTLRAICGMVRSEGEIVFGGRRLERCSTEQIARSVVVLPAPLAPSSTVMPASSTARSMPCKTSDCP